MFYIACDAKIIKIQWHQIEKIYHNPKNHQSNDTDNVEGIGISVIISEKRHQPNNLSY